MYNGGFPTISARTIGQMKSLLLVLTRLPFPPVGGDRLKYNQLLQIFHRHFRVDLVVITDEPVSADALEYCSRFADTFRVFRLRPWTLPTRAVRALVKRLPFQVAYYWNRRAWECVRSLASDSDVVCGALVRTGEYVLPLERIRIMDMADLISRNYQVSIPNVTSSLWRIIYRLEWKRLRGYEVRCAEDLQGTILVNQQDVAMLRSAMSAHRSSVWHIPNGVTDHVLDGRTRSEEYSDAVVFFGKMDTQANVDAVRWFVDRVLGRLPRGLRLLIVGADPTKDVLRLAAESRVEVTGFVDDPFLVMRSALAVVAPMHTGGGIKNKVLEAMGAGALTVANAYALEAVPEAVPGSHYVEANTEEEWISTLTRIWADPSMFQGIRANGRALIANHYTWHAYEDVLMSELRKVLHEDRWGR